MAATEFSGSADASLALDAPSTYSSDALAAASSPAAGLSALWPIGLCVIVFGSFAGAAGDILIRRSFLRMQACPSIRHVIRDRGWVWGMILTAAMDPLSTFVALLFAPATLVAPFAGMHIFWGCLLAVAWLKERMFVFDVAGAALIIAGITLIVIFSGKEQVIGTVAAFGHYLQFPGAITYICVFVVLATLSCVFSSDHVLARVLPPARHPRLSALVQRFAVSCASGIVGGATNIGAKALVVVLTEFLAAPKAALASWSTYVIAFLAAAFGLFQLYYLNAALHRFEATYVVPMINSVLIVSGSVGGILVLQEHPDNWTAFFGGLALVVAGVFVLSSRQAAGSLPGAAPRAAVAAGELVRLASFISFGDGNPGREAFGGAKPGGEGDSTQEESPEGAEKDASLAAAAASDAKERGIDSGQRSSTLDTEAADMCDEIDSKFGGVRGGETPPLSVCGERKQVDGRGPRGRALPAAPSSADIEAAASERGGVEEDEEKGFSPREGKRRDSEETPVAAALCREQPLVRVAVAASSSEDECAEEGRRESAARDACGLREGEKLTDNRRYIIFPRACLRALPRSRLAAVGQNGSEAEEVVTQAAEAPRHSSERKSRPEKFCRVRAPASPLMVSCPRGSAKYRRQSLTASDSDEAAAPPPIACAASWSFPARVRESDQEERAQTDSSDDGRRCLSLSTTVRRPLETSRHVRMEPPLRGEPGGLAGLPDERESGACGVHVSHANRDASEDPTAAFGRGSRLSAVARPSRSNGDEAPAPWITCENESYALRNGTPIFGSAG